MDDKTVKCKHCGEEIYLSVNSHWHHEKTYSLYCEIIKAEPENDPVDDNERETSQADDQNSPEMGDKCKTCSGQKGWPGCGKDLSGACYHDAHKDDKPPAPEPDWSIIHENYL